MNTAAIKWEREVEILPSGHRLFTEQHIAGKSKRVAIADESGVYPQNTDDGILWLDGPRPGGPIGRFLKVGYNVTTKRSYCIVPVHNDENFSSWITVDPATMLRLAVKFDWLIQDKKSGDRYRIAHR